MTTAFSTIMTTIFSSGAPFSARISLSAFFGRTSSCVAASAAHRRRRRWQSATTGGPHVDQEPSNSYLCVSA